MPHLCKAREMLLAVVSLSAQESLTWPLTCLALSVAKVEAFSGINGGHLQQCAVSCSLLEHASISILCLFSNNLHVSSKRLSRLKVQPYP